MSGYRLTKKYHLYYCWSMWQIKRVFWRGSPIKNSIAGPELTDVTLSHCPTPLFAPKAERQKYFMSSINGNHGLPFWSFGPLSFLQANYTQSKFASGHRHHLEVQDLWVMSDSLYIRPRCVSSQFGEIKKLAASTLPVYPGGTRSRVKCYSSQRCGNDMDTAVIGLLQF